MVDIKKLDKLSFNSLDKLGINWRQLIKEDKELQKKYLQYLATKKDWIIVNMDYSQLEIYVMASLAKDAALIGAVNAGMDIHSFNCEKVFKLDLKAIEKARKDAVTSDDVKAAEAALEDFKSKRKTIKALTFSLSYGAGKEKIASDLRITIPEAKKLIDDFYNAYPSVKIWQNSMLLGAVQRGYIETPFGRRRATPKIHKRFDAYDAFGKELMSAIQALKKNKEYWSLREEVKTVLNSPIQSLASDMCSLAACKTKEAFRDAKLRAEMYFWVHDSITFAVHMDDAEQAIDLVANIMENNVKYTNDPVNYRTSIEVGYNYEWVSEIKRDEWIASSDKGSLIEKHLEESLDKDLKKKFKLIVKSTAENILDMKQYIASVKATKEEYFESLIEKLNLPGVYTPQEYMAYMNSVSLEEYEESFDTTESDDGDSD